MGQKGLLSVTLDENSFIDVFIVFITHSDELFEFMRISQDDIENGDKIDVINEEDTLDLQIYFCTKLWLLSMLL